MATLPYQFGSAARPLIFHTNNNNLVQAYWQASVLSSTDLDATITFDIYLNASGIVWINQSSFWLKVEAADELGLVSDWVQIPAPHLIGGANFTKYSGTITLPFINGRIKFTPLLTCKVTSTSALPKALEYVDAMNSNEELEIGSKAIECYLGGQKVTDIYLGASKVKEVYLGSIKVK